MKKIILIILVMFSTGCYDYKELNDLAIISGIAIDYDNNNYNISLEVLNDNTKDEESYFIEGNGKTINDAFYYINNKINHIPFYSHIKVMIINKNVNYDELINYIIKNNNINNDFYMVSTDNTAKNVLEHKTNQEKIVSENIYTLLDKKKYKITFEEFIKLYLDKDKKLILPTINIEDNDLSIRGEK